MEIVHVYNAIVRRKWLVVQSVVFFLLAAAAITFYLPKQFQAATKVIVESSTTTNSILSELGLEEMAMSLGSSSDDMQSKLTLAVTRPILEEVVWKLQLRDDKGRLLRPEKLIVGGTVDALMGAPQIKVSQIQGTSLIMVSSTSTDAELSRLMADTLANVYIRQSEDRARHDVREAHTFVTEQLALVQAELDSVLASIAEAQRSEEVIDLESEIKAAVSRVSSLMLEQEQILANIQGLRAQVAEEERNQAREGVDLVSPASISSNAQVRSMRDAVSELRRQREGLLVEVTEAHPDVVLLDNNIKAATAELELALKEQHELSPTLAQLRSSLAAEREKVKQIGASIARVTEEFGTYPDKMRRLSQLGLAAAATEKLFTGLQQQQYEIAIAEALTMSDLQIVEPAVKPERHTRPRLMVNMFGGLFLGLVFGLGLVLAFEYLDDSIKSPEELKEAWDLPQLGTIPRFAKRESGRLIVDLPAHAPVAEAYRTVRNNIAYATLDKPPRFLAVTSAIPEEGKSTLSMNMAISLARDGKRVVLVDADFRRPNQHRFFPDTNNHVGVTNVLLGEVSLDEALQPLPVPNLHLLAAGRLPSDPGALVESLKMRQLLADVARKCDMVIVDTPPVMVVNDAVVLGRQVEQLILVAEAGRVTRRILTDVRGRLENSGLAPLGIVLNKLDVSSSSYGGYYRYYRDHYAPGSGGNGGDGDQESKKGLRRVFPRKGGAA